MSETIVVGFNGSESATEAVMWAAAEAVLRNAHLRIVSCFDVPTVALDAAGGWAAGAAAQAAREVAAANAAQATATVTARHPTLTCTTDVLPGPATHALLSDVSSADLVVVGSSRHEGAAAFWLGTTARHLVHDSPCPVAVIRSTASCGAPERVVVGVDGSPASDRAVRWAGDEADRHHVELVLVHGWSYPYARTDTRSEQARDLTEIDADCTLTGATAAARQRCGVTVTRVLIEDSAVSALLGAVRDGDLLVVGSRGRGGVRARLFGSTANAILDHAAVPVVVVRADSDEEPASTQRVAALTLA